MNLRPEDVDVDEVHVGMRATVFGAPGRPATLESFEVRENLGARWVAAATVRLEDRTGDEGVERLHFTSTRTLVEKSGLNFSRLRLYRQIPGDALSLLSPADAGVAEWFYVNEAILQQDLSHPLGQKTAILSWRMRHRVSKVHQTLPWNHPVCLLCAQSDFDVLHRCAEIQATALRAGVCEVHQSELSNFEPYVSFGRYETLVLGRWPDWGTSAPSDTSPDAEVG